MKSKFVLASIGIAAAFLFTTTPASAKTPDTTDPAAATKPAEKPKKDTYGSRGEVVSITSTLLTTKGAKGKEDHKFTITPDTKYVNGDKPATMADVKVGQEVGLSVKRAEGTGNPTALKINVGVKQAGTPKKAAEKPADTKGKKQS